MVKGRHDEVTLTIDELRNIFTAGQQYGEQQIATINNTLKEDEDVEWCNDFDEFMNLHHAIELI